MMIEKADPCFICDCMCHGAAVCLRAYGYYAYWEYGISDAEVVRIALGQNLIVVTGDGEMLKRRVFSGDRLKFAFIPVGLDKWGQFSSVLSEYPLIRKSPRCMKCGGELEPVDKKACLDEIPPRTAEWLDEYYRCNECFSLFWEGTHWLKIEEKLDIYGKSDGDSGS